MLIDEESTNMSSYEVGLWRSMLGVMLSKKLKIFSFDSLGNINKKYFL